jgi:hypothetical protein
VNRSPTKYWKRPWCHTDSPANKVIMSVRRWSSSLEILTRHMDGRLLSSQQAWVGSVGVSSCQSANATYQQQTRAPCAPWLRTLLAICRNNWSCWHAPGAIRTPAPLLCSPVGVGQLSDLAARLATEESFRARSKHSSGTEVVLAPRPLVQITEYIDFGSTLVLEFSGY